MYTKQELLERLNKNSNADFMIEILIKIADEEIAKKQEREDFTLFKSFVATGERTEYEKIYFAKRKRLSVFSIAYAVTDSEKYKEAVENCLFDICTEYTWMLPAHIRYEQPFDAQDIGIDLFSAETAASIAEVLKLLENELDEGIVFLAKRELRRRIIEPYSSGKYTYWYESWPSNWCAVCMAGVGITFFCEAEKAETDKMLPRMLKTMDEFLKSYGDDGCCLEGVNYWGFGFGRYVFFADALLKYSGGKTNLFDNPKVHRIALFRQNTFMKNNLGTEFADCGYNTSGYTKYNLSAYLAKIYSDAAMPVRARFEKDKLSDLNCFSEVIRDIMWFDEYGKEEKITPYIFYPDAAWMIKNTETYSFAAKGGYNDEPHNHNDVGSFMILSDSARIIAELGSNCYTRQYFSAERYDYLPASSRGHSVPVINGKLQHCGEKYNSKVIKANENIFEIEFSNAYFAEGLKSLKRKFDLSNESVRMTDSFVFTCAPEDIAERFVTFEKPIISKGLVKIDNFGIYFSGEKFDASCSAENFEGRLGIKLTAYLLDIKPKKYEKNIKFECEIKKL